MERNTEISCAECIYCGSTENVFSFCKTQQTEDGEKKICYCTCTNCAKHIEKNLSPEVPCETCDICGKRTDVFAFCSYAPIEDGKEGKEARLLTPYPSRQFPESCHCPFSFFSSTPQLLPYLPASQRKNLAIDPPHPRLFYQTLT